MKNTSCILLTVALLLGFHASVPSARSAPRADDWVPLFDGKTTKGWRGFKQPQFPEKGWKVEDGILKKVPQVRGGDIITEETFGDFELEWEWRIPAGANNGIKYFITEQREQAVGHEYQMIDDAQAPDGKHATASFYDVLPPAAERPRTRINEWNQSRVRVAGDRVEHWLNGVKVLSYEPGSDAVKAAVARSKFKNVPGFGAKLRGHILLTDHKDEAWYRHIRIRRLDETRK